MKIEVTQEDIAAGIRGDSCKCPVALAIKRALGERYFVAVNNQGILVSNQDGGRILRIPPRVNMFVRVFDFGMTPIPISFELEAPEREQ